MKAFLIDAQNQSLEAIDIASMEDIVKAVGYDTIESDAIGDDGDRLFFDEECFIRGSEGRFKLDSLVPVSGKGVVMSSSDGSELADVQIANDDLLSRLKYL